nr:hypothetical protein [Tanacetum cinerariifolium]
SQIVSSVPWRLLTKGTGISTTNYPGRIPPGTYIQSATIDEKLANDKKRSGNDIGMGRTWPAWFRRIGIM